MTTWWQWRSRVFWVACFLLVTDGLSRLWLDWKKQSLLLQGASRALFVESVSKKRQAIASSNRSDRLFSSTEADHIKGGGKICNSLCSFVNNGTTATSDCSRTGLSTTMLWNQLRPKILDASYFPETHANRTDFQEWVNSLFHFYTTDRLRRSVTFPVSSKAMQRVVEILDDAVTSGAVPSKNDGSSNSMVTGRPLRIMVIGGSVTAGHGCKQNPLNLDGGPKGNTPFKECAWPARWENLINKVLFDNESSESNKAVDVTNIAVGGSNSDIGAMMLEYHLFPSDYVGVPDVVVGAFAANDVQHPVSAKDKLHTMESFIDAAKRLDCQEGMPLVIDVDDFYGLESYGYKAYQASDHSSLINQATTWHQNMGVSYANVVRHAIYGNLTNPRDFIPLTSSIYDVHLGMGFHIGMSWTLLYNTINAIVDHCNENTIPPLQAGANAIQGDERPAQYIPHLSKQHSSHAVLTKEWEKRQSQEFLRCRDEIGELQKPCSYAWMVNRLTDVTTKEHIRMKLDPVLVDYDTTSGWVALGFPIRQPRAGWYANRENATFTTRLVSTTAPIKFLTVLYLKTYDKGDAIVRVTASVTSQSDNTTSSGIFEISSKHQVRTSVHYSEHFELPGDGAVGGDVVETRFDLIRGNSFKIAGLAYCSR